MMVAMGAERRAHHEHASPSPRRDEEHGLFHKAPARSSGSSSSFFNELKLWWQLLGVIFAASIFLVMFSGRMAKSIAFHSWHPLAEETAAVPVRPRPDLDDSPETFARWSARHEANVQEAERLGARIDLTFLGDSITEGWLRHPLGHHSHDGSSPEPVRDTFEREFGSWGEVTDWGIGGDRRGLSFSLALPDPHHFCRACDRIGTNNLKDPAVTAEEVSGEVAAVLELLRDRLPDTRLLILGIFPRAQRPWDPPADPHGSFVSFETLPRFSPWNSSNPYFLKIRKINMLIEEAVAAAGDHARYLDCSRELLKPFAPPPGSKEPLVGPPLREDQLASGDWVDREIFGDYLHLTPEGYKRWADCMRPVLSDWKSVVLPPLNTVASVLARIDEDSVPMLHADHSIIENGR